MNEKKENIVLTMIIIYLTLISVSWVLYYLIVRFINDEHQDLIIGLLSWSSTIFATIALLCTVNNWKNQRKAEVLSQISYDCSVKLVELQQDFDSLLSNCLGILNNYKNDGLRSDFNIFYRNFKLIHRSLLRIQSGRYSKTLTVELLNMMELVEGNKSLLSMIINNNEQFFANVKKEQVLLALNQSSSDLFSICNKIQIELEQYMYSYD